MKVEMTMVEIEQRGDVGILWLDQPGEAVNTLSPETLDAFEAALDRVADDAGIRGLVVASRKPDSFIAGADLRVLQSARDRDEVEGLSRRGHALLERVRSLGKPVVAAIHGPALGGGLEVALACTYRIASTHPKTRFALPEVRLGLLPAGGGTQLLPRLVGLQRALDMLLTGKNVYPRPARRMGLIDALIHPPGLVGAAVQAARRLAEGSLERRNAPPSSLPERLLEATPLSRRLIYRKARERVLAETKGNYPAPLRILACVQTGLKDGLEAGLDAEAQAFAELAFSPEARALIFLFFAQQAARKNPWQDQARDVDVVGIIGAGLMGSGIAEVSAENGYEVVLKDQNLEMAARGKQKVWQNIRRKAKKGAISAFERDVIVDRVVPVASYDAFSNTGLIIEAAPEDAGLKRKILAETEAATRDDGIFASNTSSIPIADLAADARRPERVVGMHYFSPVPKVPLLEIVRTPQNTDEVIGTAYAVGLRQGKTVIVVNDGPGFYTTRILAAYMNEALNLLQEGAAIDAVDRAMERFGFPMGPYALFDLVGVDVAAKISEVLAPFFAGRGLVANHTAGAMVRTGLLGQKTGAGFYTYEQDDRGRPRKRGANEAAYAFFGTPARRALEPSQIQDRLALVMVNEATYCLHDGILASPRDGDVGAVFGLGFPPFRGGPFRYVDAETAPAVTARLQRLALSSGPQYRPSPVLLEHARTGARFYPS